MKFEDKTWKYRGYEVTLEFIEESTGVVSLVDANSGDCYSLSSQ